MLDDLMWRSIWNWNKRNFVHTMFLCHGRQPLGAPCHDYSLSAYFQISISFLHGLMQPRHADAHFGMGGLTLSLGIWVYKATMGPASSAVVAKPGGLKRNTKLLEASSPSSHESFLMDAGMLTSAFWQIASVTLARRRSLFLVTAVLQREIPIPKTSKESSPIFSFAQPLWVSVRRTFVSSSLLYFDSIYFLYLLPVRSPAPPHITSTEKQQR